MKVGQVPALVDTGAQFSCIRSDVIEYLYMRGEECTFLPCSLSCLLADGQRAQVTDAVGLHVRLLDFSWNHEFKILNGGPFPAILGMDFLQRTGMKVDLSSSSYCFAFAPSTIGSFSAAALRETREPYLQQLCGEVADISTLQMSHPKELNKEVLMGEFSPLFSASLGCAKCAPYNIELSDAAPVRAPPYRCAPPKLQIFKQVVNELLEQGVVRPSKSNYASPAFLVPKSGGGFRMVVDYRRVNSKVVFDSYPMPSIEQAFQHFAGATVFTVLDLNSAYYQIPLTTRSRRVTAFCTPFGLFEFNRLPMGISVGSQGLTRVIDELFADLKGSFVFNYLDDLVVYSPSVKEHAKHVRIVLQRLQDAGFTLNPEKITIGASEIKYLGHSLSSRGIRVLPDRVAAIKEYPRPANLRALRRFIGMAGFYARFIPDFSKRAAVLHALKKKGVKFEWTDEHQCAFDSLKQALSEAPVLQVPDFDKEFVLVTDASDIAVSAVLNQRVGQELAPVSFYSRLLTSAERNYSTYEKECTAVLFGCEKCRSYLEHKEFELHCDNLALCWLLKRVKDIGRLGRWVLRLAPFKFRVKHTRGADNVVADALSRVFEGKSCENPELTCAVLMESLPLVYSSIEEHQADDPFCKDLRQKILTAQSTAEKFRIHQNLICFFPRGARRRRWVVPKILRPMLLKYLHDSPLAGHLGSLKTFYKVAQNFWWPKMREEVFLYVRKCSLCQQAKPAQDTRVGYHVAEPSTEPLEKLFVDFVGPLTRTRRGNSAILVVLDSFSKFVMFYPVRRVTSQVVVDCLERNYLPAYGTPKIIVSDNARVFCSKQVKDLCFRWGINHVTTTPYYPQGSLAERVNRNLKSALKIFHHESQNTWDEDLPWLASAFNTALHESTKTTPDLLFLGREIKSPLETRWDLSPADDSVKSGTGQSFWTQAYHHLKSARNKVALRYNRDRKEHNFKVGDTVMYRKHLVSSKAQNISSKLLLRWSEPLVIARIVNSNNVLLANPNTGVIVRKAHVSQLKEYNM